MTRFAYDNSGKLVQEIRPMQQRTSFKYDEQGRLDFMTDARQQVTDYEYDDQSRLETIDYDDGRRVTLSYDVDGNLAGYVVETASLHNALSPSEKPQKTFTH